MLQGALAGLASGGLYAIVAVCLVIMSRLVRVVNFAQTAVGMFGSFSAVLIGAAGVPTPVAIVIGVVVGGLLSALIGLVIQVFLADADVSVRSAVTVGALLVLVALSFIVFGTKPLPFPPVLPGVAFTVGGVSISQVTVLLLVMTALVALGARLVLTRTTLGSQLRAVSDRPLTAELIGIRTRSLAIGTWITTGVIATIVVTVVAPVQSNDALSLSTLVIPASAAALAGGFRRLDLAVAGAVVLGVLNGALAQNSALTIVQYFLPFIVIVALLLYLQRKEVWDAAR